MKAKLINDAAERTYALIFERGDEVVTTLERFAREHELTASRITAIGALERATLGYFNWETRQYEEIPVEEQVEVLSLVGDMALKDGEPSAHVHIVLGRRDGSTVGGHLLAAQVRPTLEVVMVESPGYLRRVRDPESGLALIDIGA